MNSLCRLRRLFCLRSCEAVILGGIVVGMVGCATTVSREGALPEGAPSRVWAPEELLKNLSQRLQDFHSLRALAKVYYSSPDGRGGFQEAVLVHRPDRLRLETLSFMGATLIVTADGDEIEGYHPREGLFYRGRSSRKNLFRYTQIPLGLNEVTSLLMGLPPVGVQTHAEIQGLSLSWERAGGGKETVAFDPSLGLPSKWVRSAPDGRRELSAEFSNFVSTPAGFFPLKITLEAPSRQIHVDISYQDPELNVDLPSSLFKQQKPDNVKEVPLGS